LAILAIRQTLTDGPELAGERTGGC
jgi:hypothetical protein